MLVKASKIIIKHKKIIVKVCHLVFLIEILTLMIMKLNILMGMYPQIYSKIFEYKLINLFYLIY